MALRWLRNMRGWPQKQLAAQAAITKSMLSSYETGKQTPNLATIGKILKALGADFCDVYCAMEINSGRLPEPHKLRAHFVPGEEAPPRRGPRRSPNPPTDDKSATDAGAPTETAPQLPAPLERALSEGLPHLETIARYLLASKQR